MNALYPFHVLAVFIHTLIERPVFQNALDARCLKGCPFPGAATTSVEIFGNSQHGRSLVVLVEHILDDRAFVLVDNQPVIDHFVPIRTATAAVPTAGSLDRPSLAGTQSNILSLLLGDELQ